MKNVLSLLLLIFFATASTAQYIEYHNLVNEANECRYNKDYEKSLELFKEGFAKVEYVHSMNYARAAVAAAKLKKYELVKLYISKAVEAGYPIAFINNKGFNGFRKSNQYQILKDEIKALQNKSKTNFNKEYKRKIDSLHYIDQKLLRGNDNVTEFNLNREISYSDAANFKCLMELIDEFGFPSEQEIGYQGYRKSRVIIHHSARLVENHGYHAKLLGYVQSGEYLPENYCWVIDQGQELLKQPLIYYHWDVAKNISELTTSEMNDIDLKRKEVGLASVRRIEVIKNTSPQRNRVKW